MVERVLAVTDEAGFNAWLQDEDVRAAIALPQTGAGAEPKPRWWAFLAGRLADGTPVGLNLVERFNESAGTNENALWLGDKLYPLARAVFEYDRNELMSPWRMRTEDGAVDLRFQPLYVHREDHDFKVVVSHFAQPLGLFEGTVRVDGQTYTLTGVPGVTENQDMLW